MEKENPCKSTAGGAPLTAPVTSRGRQATALIPLLGWCNKANVALEKPPRSIVTSADYQALEANSPRLRRQQETGTVCTGERERGWRYLFSQAF